MKEGEKYEIPVDGSLGLLALGHTGLIAWRRHRDAAKKKEGDKSGNDAVNL